VYLQIRIRLTSHQTKAKAEVCEWKTDVGNEKRETIVLGYTGNGRFHALKVGTMQFSFIIIVPYSQRKGESFQRKHLVVLRRTVVLGV
jgi:hypothetical protein